MKLSIWGWSALKFIYLQTTIAFESNYFQIMQYVIYYNFCICIFRFYLYIIMV